MIPAHMSAYDVWRWISHGPGARCGSRMVLTIMLSVSATDSAHAQIQARDRAREPQHVHMHIIEPRRCTYYIDSIHFRDDPLLSEAARREAEAGRGGSGLTSPTRGADGVWRVNRDIQLGAGVPGYGKVRLDRP